MNEEKADLLTAGKIAEKYSLPAAKVKKAIADLKLKPAAKKGACSYYSPADALKIKASLK